MSRFCHYIKDNKSSETIHHCIFIDCETDQISCGDGEVKHQLTFGFACYQRRDNKLKWRKPEWVRFTTNEQLYRFIQSKLRSKIKLYVWCHNSNFDYPVLRLFEWLSDIGAEMQVAVISAPPTIVRYRINQSTIILLDTLNIWRVPLETLGTIVGTYKLPMPDKTASQEQWDEYGRQDVEIIRKAVTGWADFLMVNDYGGFSSTLAAQSMRLYRHRFLTTKIAIHDNEKALELERNCYHGGRNEAYFIGRKQQRYKLLDVNSMYPYVMSSNRYPNKLFRVRENIQPNFLSYAISQWLCCGKFLISTDTPVYPVVKDNKLIFPIGTFDCYLSTPEIVYALEHNHIQKCYQLAMYEHAYLFTEFITYLYDKRRKAESEDAPTDAYLYKILMNSHYGKWGQKGYHTKYIGEAKNNEYKTETIIDGETGKPIKRVQFGTRISLQFEQGSARDSFPAIAAHVTAYARMYLWQLIVKAGQRNVLYVDTDSLLVNNNGYRNLRTFLDSTALGALKLEGTYDEIEIYGCKDYRFGTKERHKGVKRKAEWLTDNSVRQDRWESLKGMMRKGRIHEPRTKTIVKTLHRNYTKGIINNNGIVEPINLP